MSGVIERLYTAVKDHSGMEDVSIVDAGRHGADAGWSGFTYYTDTCEFYEKNKDDIWELLDQYADDFGETCLSMIAGFGSAAGVCSAHQFENLMAWFALEEVGRWLADNPQDDEEDEDEDQ